MSAPTGGVFERVALLARDVGDFHALTLLREHRGDGHVAALIGADLSGIEALVSHTATGRGFTRPAAQATRGWSDDDWAAGVAGLRERGLLEGGVGLRLTAAGERLRTQVEERTDPIPNGASGQPVTTFTVT